MTSLVEHHARFLEGPVWHLNRAEAARDLELIASSGHFGRLALFLNDGSVFAAFDPQLEESGIERILRRSHLIRESLHVHPLSRHGGQIGRIELTWLNRNVYVYFYAIFVIALVLKVGQYYLRLVENRHLLEHRVEERTEELSRSVAQLQEEVAERLRAEERLEHSLEEKEVLIKEVHHRVKNNLQVISSMLSLQAGYIENDEARAAFADGRARIESIAQIHERLYQAVDLSRIDVPAYLEALASRIFNAQAHRDGVELSTDIEPVALTMSQAVPCRLVLNELLTNALKHAFPHGEGRVFVSLKKVGRDQACLSVCDNGQGIPEGVDIKRGETLGVLLVSSLAKTLHVQLDVTQNGGTTVCVTMPLSAEVDLGARGGAVPESDRAPGRA